MSAEARAKRVIRFQTLLEEQARSGRNLRKFAETEGLPYTTLTYWRRRYLMKARSKVSGKQWAPKKVGRFTAVRTRLREAATLSSWAEPFVSYPPPSVNPAARIL